MGLLNALGINLPGMLGGNPFSALTGQGGPPVPPTVVGQGFKSLIPTLTQAFTGQMGQQPPTSGPLEVPAPQAPKASSNQSPLYAQAASAAKAAGLDPNAFTQAIGIESNWNPNAHNRSGASGLLQFMPETAKNYGLSNPQDPSASIQAGVKLWSDNKKYLTSRLGREPTGGELYLAHQQGAQGAVNLLKNPGAPAESVIGRAALVQNGGKPGMTAGQFANMWTSRIKGGASSAPSVSPTFDAMSAPAGQSVAPGANVHGVPAVNGLGSGFDQVSDANTALADPGNPASGRGKGGMPDGSPASPNTGSTVHNSLSQDYKRYAARRTTDHLRALSPVATIQTLANIGKGLQVNGGGSTS